MSDHLSIDEQNKLLTEECQEIVSGEADKKKIKISDENLYKILEWVPRQNFPNVNLASRRYWWFCDQELMTRTYEFYSFKLYVERPNWFRWLIGYKNVNRLEVGKTVIVDGRPVYDKATHPLPEDEPPYNFTVFLIEIPKTMDEKATMQFLQTIKPQLNAVKLNITFSKMHVLDKYQEVFDGCLFVRIYMHDRDILAKKEIRNCDSLEIYSVSSGKPSQDSIIDWLHSPLTNDSVNKRTFYFRQDDVTPDSYDVTLVERLIKKFSEDTTKHKFVFGLGLGGLFELNFLEENFRMENEQTGEVLYTSQHGQGSVLIRCDKEEEGTILIEDFYEKNGTTIFHE